MILMKSCWGLNGTEPKSLLEITLDHRDLSVLCMMQMWRRLLCPVAEIFGS